MNFKTSRIIDSNGQKHRVGWDEHGWFSIQMVELWGPDDLDDDHGFDVIEYEGEEAVVLPEGDENGKMFPLTSFTPGGCDELIAAIKDR